MLPPEEVLKLECGNREKITGITLKACLKLQLVLKAPPQIQTIQLLARYHITKNYLYLIVLNNFIVN